jgi:hypothetical protein
MKNQKLVNKKLFLSTNNADVQSFGSQSRSSCLQYVNFQKTQEALSLNHAKLLALEVAL